MANLEDEEYYVHTECVVSGVFYPVGTRFRVTQAATARNSGVLVTTLGDTYLQADAGSSLPDLTAPFAAPENWAYAVSEMQGNVVPVSLMKHGNPAPQPPAEPLPAWMN